MITTALALLFVSGGLFALASIATTLHRIGATALRLREALGACPEGRESHFSVTELRVMQAEGVRIPRPDFGARLRVGARVRPAPARIRAAA